MTTRTSRSSRALLMSAALLGVVAVIAAGLAVRTRITTEASEAAFTVDASLHPAQESVEAVDGTVGERTGRHVVDGCEVPHNPSVVGSIPTGPTNAG